MYDLTLNLFDLHCDTPSELYRHAEKLDYNSLNVCLNGANAFHRYSQVMAIFTPQALDNETGFRNFHKTADYLMHELERLSYRVSFVRSAEGYFQSQTHARVFLSVEDARILNGKSDRLAILHARGVRFLTPVWGGENCLGGAHDTSVGLTDFGKQTVDDCFRLGIVPDISHASEQTAEDILTIAEKHGKPVVATHSASYSVRAHSRNLRDEQFEAVKKSGGLVGICLYSQHLCDRNDATISDIIAHVEHYFSLGGENTVAFGSDFDGAKMPNGIRCPSDLFLVAEELARLNYTNSQIRHLFYRNAEAFVNRNLI